MFQNRSDAGRQLAARLMHLKSENPVVLALPRGGVPVAFEVARALEASLDLVLVRKIGVPWQPELAAGAVVDGDHPETVENEDVTRLLNITGDFIRTAAERELQEIDRRRALYLSGRDRIPVSDRTAILVDDGIATGTTTRAALRAVRRGKPRRLVLAVPVAPPETQESLRSECDELVCLSGPSYFMAIGAFYADFHQVTDDEVVALLRRARENLKTREKASGTNGKSSTARNASARSQGR